MFFTSDARVRARDFCRVKTNADTSTRDHKDKGFTSLTARKTCFIYTREKEAGTRVFIDPTWAYAVFRFHVAAKQADVSASTKKGKKNLIVVLALVFVLSLSTFSRWNNALMIALVTVCLRRWWKSCDRSLSWLIRERLSIFNLFNRLLLKQCKKAYTRTIGYCYKGGDNPVVTLNFPVIRIYYSTDHWRVHTFSINIELMSLVSMIFLLIEKLDGTKTRRERMTVRQCG